MPPSSPLIHLKRRRGWATHPGMIRPLLLGALLLAGPALAASQGDWFASLYTGDGVELRNDERVFTLFALFNALGFDQGPVTRKSPVPKIIYHPVRQLVRGRVIGGDPEVRKAADAFFDSHPKSLGHYLDYAIHAGQPPFTTGPKARDLNDLKGFEQILAKAWKGWKLDEVLAQVQPEYRAALKTYLDGLDQPLAKARTLLKVPESTEVLLVVNLLDAQDQVRAEHGDGQEVFLIAGPSDKPNIEGVIDAFARLEVEPKVSKAAAKWAGGAQVLREAQLAGASEKTVADYATELFARAVAMQAMGADDKAYEAAAAKGYFGLKELAKSFGEGKPLEAWAADGLSRVEARRPQRK